MAGAGLLAVAVCAGIVGIAGTAAGDVGAGGSSALGPRALRGRAHEILLDPRFQATAPASDGDPAAPEAPVPAARRPTPHRWFLPLFAFAFSGVASLVIYILAGVILVLLAAWAIQEAGLRRARRGAGAPSVPRASAEGSARQGLGEASDLDAHRLAGQGRYAEAVHALLLAAIRQLAARAPTPPDSSRTSRELARTLPLQPGARAAFGELVGAVERSLFGGAAVDRAGFDASLACFRAVFGSSE